MDENDLREMNLTLYISVAVQAVRRMEGRSPTLSEVVSGAQALAARAGISLTNLAIVHYLDVMHEQRQIGIVNNKYRLTRRRREDYLFIPVMMAEDICTPGVPIAVHEKKQMKRPVIYGN